MDFFCDTTCDSLIDAIEAGEVALTEADVDAKIKEADRLTALTGGQIEVAYSPNPHTRGDLSTLETPYYVEAQVPLGWIADAPEPLPAQLAARLRQAAEHFVELAEKVEAQ